MKIVQLRFDLLGQPNDREAKTCTLSAMYVYMYILIDEGIKNFEKLHIIILFFDILIIGIKLNGLNSRDS